MGAQNHTPEDLWYADGGLVTLGSDKLSGAMARALALIPAEAADRILASCLMLSTGEDPEELASVVPADLAEGRALIIFSPAFFEQAHNGRDEVMLHECAHVLLGHKFPALSLDPEEYDRNEREAKGQVADWLSP